MPPLVGWPLTSMPEVSIRRPRCCQHWPAEPEMPPGPSKAQSTPLPLLAGKRSTIVAEATNPDPQIDYALVHDHGDVCLMSVVRCGTTQHQQCAGSIFPDFSGLVSGCPLCRFSTSALLTCCVAHLHPDWDITVRYISIQKCIRWIEIYHCYVLIRLQLSNISIEGSLGPLDYKSVVPTISCPVPQLSLLLISPLTRL